MKLCFSVFIWFAFAICFASQVNAQHISLISPSYITYRGISIADNTHSMAVGDSASILLLSSGDGWVSWSARSLTPPCDKSHTLFGVSYYSSAHAVTIGDAGLIFITSNSGTTWKPSGVGITGQTLRGIVHTADGALTIVGDSGIILRSTNSGADWTRIASSTTRAVNAISINAKGHGFFVGAHGLLGKTSDNGLTWSNVTDTSAFGYKNPLPVTLRAVAISNADSAVVAGDSGAVGITLDGVSWRALIPSWLFGAPPSSSIIQSTSFSAVNPTGTWTGSDWTLFSPSDFAALIYNDSLVMYPSTVFGDADGGTDTLAWRYECTTVRNSISQTAGAFGELWSYNPTHNILQFTQSNDNLLFASIDSLGKGYATGPGGVFLKTTDNGLTWNQYLSNSDYKATDIYTIDSNHAFAVGWAGSMYRTSNGGTTWDSTLIDPNQERLHSIANPVSGVFVVCGDYGTMLRSTDNALTWKPSTLSTTSFLEAVAFSSSEIGVSVGTSGTILRTTDQGASWSAVNNPLTGTPISYRKVEGFPTGIFYATTDSSGLYKSSDNGQNWSAVTGVPHTLAMEFYNERIGVIAESAWSSAKVNDTMRFAFTRDAFATKPIEFNIPIVNNSRMTFHFLDSTSFLCLGSDGFVVKVEMSQSGVRVTNLAPQSSPIRLYPNPNTSHSTTIEYDLAHSGATRIELLNELGERVQILFEANQAMGHHIEPLRMSSELHGTFFIRVLVGNEVEMLPIVVE
jgi:photosystem II stability/assembly factor-like uncharacterized protein